MANAPAPLRLGPTPSALPADQRAPGWGAPATPSRTSRQIYQERREEDLGEERGPAALRQTLSLGGRPASPA